MHTFVTFPFLLVCFIFQVDRHCVRQGVLVRVLEEDGEDLHPAGLAVTRSGVHGAFQGAAAVSRIFTSFRPENKIWM